MTFLVQFKTLRRGVPEVIRTNRVSAIDAAAALACVQSLPGTRHWPVRTDVLRVMDEGGRALIDWTVPAGLPDSSAYSHISGEPTADELQPARQRPTEEHLRRFD